MSRWHAMTENERADVTAWLVATCRLFGASLATAHLVTGTFAAGLDREPDE